MSGMMAGDESDQAHLDAEGTETGDKEAGDYEATDAQKSNFDTSKAKV